METELFPCYGKTIKIDARLDVYFCINQSWLILLQLSKVLLSHKGTIYLSSAKYLIVRTIWLV